MILVDSSVWIDYFRGDATPNSSVLIGCLDMNPSRLAT